MSHTPGPWITGEGEYADQVFEKSAVPDGELDWGAALICETAGNNENAALIAAAPELLAALDSLVGMVIENGGRGDLVDNALAAIAKAEGRTE